jgi:hypothetical protein
MSLTVTLPEHAALALRTAARAQIRSLRRRRPHEGRDLNVLDVEHLEAFIHEVEAVYPPLSKEERDLISALRQEARIPANELDPETVDALVSRNRVAWYKTPHDTVYNTTWPAPASAWIGLRV